MQTDYQRVQERWTKRRDEIKRLFREGKSMRDIAKRYGITRQRVHAIVTSREDRNA